MAKGTNHDASFFHHMDDWKVEAMIVMNDARHAAIEATVNPPRMSNEAMQEAARRSAAN